MHIALVIAAGLARVHAQGELRFARDEKPAAPPINAGKPYDYEGSWHRDGYGAAPKEPPPVQQAGYKTTQR